MNVNNTITRSKIRPRRLAGDAIDNKTLLLIVPKCHKSYDLPQDPKSGPAWRNIGELASLKPYGT